MSSLLQKHLQPLAAAVPVTDSAGLHSPYSPALVASKVIPMPAVGGNPDKSETSPAGVTRVVLTRPAVHKFDPSCPRMDSEVLLFSKL